jgi:putative ABC transport system permease protein
MFESFRRVWYLLNRRRFDEGLRREMESHRQMMADPRGFGNMRRLREESADVWGWTWLDDMVRDVRFAARTLRRMPGFTLVAVSSLALATGATTAIFSVVNSVLLKPLPFADPDRLVQVYGRAWREDRGGSPDPLSGPVAPGELDEYARQSTSFDGFAAYSLTTRHLDGPAGPERLTAVQADLGFFALLGVDAVVGRTFLIDDPQEVAVVSARLWESRFNKDPSLPGRTVTLDGRTFTVLGVMPESFQFPYSAGSLLSGALPETRTDLWIPLEPLRTSSSAQLRRGRASVVARLRPDVALATANAELSTIARRIEEQYRGTAIRVGVRLVPLAEVVLGRVSRSLWLLFAAVGLVLATACANVANLMLARMSVRTREVVTRAALGASPRRLARQFLAESLIVSLAGGLFGVAIARWGSDLLVALGSTLIPRAHEIALDWRAFMFLLAVCLVTAVLFGLAPALAASRVDVQTVTKEAGGHSTPGGTFGRLRDILVIVEVALAFVLALGAAMVVREVTRLRNVDTGMQISRVLTLHVTPRATAADYYAIEARVAQLPGVTGAGFTQLVPLQNWGWEADFSIRGRPREDASERRVAGLKYVTPGYFRALGIPIRQGRSFTDGDTTEAPRVILVNDALARRYLRNMDPVGVELDRGTIVGVVGDVRQVGLDRPADPEIYYPAAQNVTMAPDIGMSLIVHTSGRPEALATLVRSTVREVNPNLAIFNVKTMDEVLSDSLWELNLYLWLVGLFAALALVLAAIGLYGVVSFSVTSRMREFAVRLALGASPGDVARLVLARGARLAGAGLAGGVLGAMALAPFVQKLPIGVSGGPIIFLSISAGLLAIGALACLTPAIRVARVNPATALRHD